MARMDCTFFRFTMDRGIVGIAVYTTIKAFWLLGHGIHWIKNKDKVFHYLDEYEQAEENAMGYLAFFSAAMHLLGATCLIVAVAMKIRWLIFPWLIMNLFETCMEIFQCIRTYRWIETYTVIFNYIVQLTLMLLITAFVASYYVSERDPVSFPGQVEGPTTKDEVQPVSQHLGDPDMLTHNNANVSLAYDSRGQYLYSPLTNDQFVPCRSQSS